MKVLLTLMVAAVVVTLYLLSELFRALGWQICLGLSFGYFAFYCGFRWHYGWWPDFNMDREDEANSRLPRIDPSRVNWNSGYSQGFRPEDRSRIGGP